MFFLQALPFFDYVTRRTPESILLLSKPSLCAMCQLVLVTLLSTKQLTYHALVISS